MAETTNTGSYTPDSIFKLFSVKRTQVEMMSDRGNLIPENEIVMFLEDPDAMIPTQRLISAFIREYVSHETNTFSRETLTQSYADDNGQVTYIYFAPFTFKSKQGVNVITSFIEAATSIGAKRAIIITSEGFTSDAQRQIESVADPIIQIFYDFQLQANPTRHKLVPPHTKLSDDERREKLTKSRIEPRQLKNFSIDDPIVKYYGWRPGDLIRVNRTNLATNRVMVRNTISYGVVTQNRFDQEKAPNKKKKADRD